MLLDKTTTRAFAASIALVLAGAVVAGAAVFHLPILGFGSAGAESTVPHPSPSTTAHGVQPRVIVRTKYVDDVVHRPAPATSASSASAASSTGSSSGAPAQPAAGTASTYAPAAPAVAAAVAAPAWSDDGAEHAATAATANETGADD